MTEVFSILNEMSSAFNNQALPANEKLPSVSEDTTLKWRGLLHNTYAAKEKDPMNRELRKRSTSTKEKTIEGQGVEMSTELSVQDVEMALSEIKVVPESEALQMTNSSMVTTATTTTTPNTISTNTAAPSTNIKADNKEIDQKVDKPNGEKDNSKKISRLVRSKPLLHKSDRSLRSNRTNNGGDSVVPAKIITTPPLPPSDDGVVPKNVRRGRRRRENIPSTPAAVEIKTKPVSEQPVEQEKPRLIVTIRAKSATVAITNAETPSSTTSSPKRRGRKPKQGQSKLIVDQKVLNQRPLRRIKPTQKILDSEELREGFVQQNCARLNITNEELKNLEEVNSEKKVEEERRLTRRVKRETPKTESLIQGKSEKTPHVSAASAENTETKKLSEARLICAADSRAVKRNLSFSEIFKNIPRKPCPDPVEFLKEIKNSKLITNNKSPEENKKLNKKQLKRLQKVKEKHFHLLGLQRTRKIATDSENSDEAEEFVPKKKLNDVGKPGVTLRLRNFRKDDKDDRVNSGGKRKKRYDPETIPPTKKSSSVLTEELNNGLQVVSAATMEAVPAEDPTLICFCAQPSKYFLQRTAAISHCCAIDEVEGQKIGCTNEVQGDLLQLLRPSIRTSYMVLCESHKKRLVSHNCCAGCGIFLTQGIFSLCQNKHFFHRDCTMKYILNAPYDPSNPDFTGPTLAFKCPHCGIDVPDSSFRVTMKSENVPVFFTNQKHHLQRAKMSICNKPPVSSNSFLLNIERLIPEEVMNALQRAVQQLQSESPKSFTAKDLFYAIYHDSGVNKISELIASGIDLTKPFKEYNNGTCLHLVSSVGNITTLYLILSRISSKEFLNVMEKERRTAVMCAVVSRKNDILKVLVQFGADVTLKGPDGMTALHLAAKFGNFAAAQIILDYYRQSSSITKVEQFLNMTDNGRWTALVWAAEIGHADIVSYFISLGADVNICDLHNNTVLHWAALSGKIDTIYPLMVPTMQFNRQNINGDTALHIGCRQGNTRICLALVANGADLYTKNDAGDLPYDCIPDEKSQCARVLRFNMEMRNLGEHKERKIVSHDISNGRECYPVQLHQNYNNGDESIAATDFKYITKCILMQDTIQIDQRVSQMRICSCNDACTSETCQCGQISIQNWYNADGRLIDEFNYDDPAMIFECNDVCGCNKLICKNRVVQQGTKLPFHVFECEGQIKKFGVRCASKITRGTFIAEYVGEILTDGEADRRSDDSFFFDLGASEHCIDAKFYGNLSRFFNHSCDANIIPIRVYFDHQDIRFPKIAFFANRDIEPQEELAFDYGTKFWLAKYKQFTCHCGAKKCRYSAATIQKTLEEYNQRNQNSNN